MKVLKAKAMDRPFRLWRASRLWSGREGIPRVKTPDLWRAHETQGFKPWGTWKQVQMQMQVQMQVDCGTHGVAVSAFAQDDKFCGWEENK